MVYEELKETVALEWQDAQFPNHTLDIEATARAIWRYWVSMNTIKDLRHESRPGAEENLHLMTLDYFSMFEPVVIEKT
jgi:hypothetical protein